MIYRFRRSQSPLIAILFINLPCFALAPVGNGAAVVTDPSPWGGDVAVKRSDVITSAKPSGAREANQENETIHNVTVRGVHQTATAWQFGGEIQLAHRAKDGADSTNLSELNLNSAYRSGPLTPYVQVTAPVSRSAYEKENQYQLDSLGRGFWALGAGLFWQRDWSGAKVFATAELHRSFNRDFANDENQGTLKPGYGSNWSVGASYTYARFNAGASLAFSYEDPVAVRGDRSTQGGSAQRFVTPNLSLGFDLGEGWNLGAAYADQTIFPAATADLVREISLTIAWTPGDSRRIE